MRIRYAGLFKLGIAIFTWSIAQAAEVIDWNSYITPDQLELLNENQRLGLKIAIQGDMFDSGWKDSQSDMVMVIRDKSGKESPREVIFKNLEVINDGDKSLSVFRSPKDLDGTAFLSFSHIEGPDERWIYLASLKRVKRINSNNKSGPYMGSEFSYEDLSSLEVKKFDFNYLHDETLSGVDCYVVERFPRDPNSGYSRIVTWIDKENYRRIKVDFYDRKNTLLKTLVRSDYKVFLGKYWRAQTLTMNNVQTGKSTILRFNNMKFNIGLSNRDFNKNSLSRAK